VNYPGENILAISPQFNAVFIIGGTIVAIIILVLCIRALNRPWGSGSGPFVNTNPPADMPPPDLSLTPARPPSKSQRFTLPPPSQSQTSQPPIMEELSLNPVPSIGHYSYLIFRGGARKGEKISLDRFPNGTCAIGRSDVPENQLKIRDDNKISRVSHATITRDAQGIFYIQDNNSVNKVYINDQCIENKKTALQNGDKIRIGLTEFDYVNESPS
jgi:hypothetical protein